MKNIKLTIISSDTCGCCVKYRPKIEQVAEELKADIEWHGINDNDVDLSPYDLKGLPFTIISSDGQYKGYIQGDMAFERIMSEISKKINE